MMIFELPSDGRGQGVRGVAIGSCRIRNPIDVLARSGALRTCAVGLAATHAAGEALQTLKFVAGEIDIPDSLSPLIFDTDRTPSTQDFSRMLNDGVDSFLVEVSDDRLFSYRGVCLQQNFLSINLVRPYGSALLNWFRTLCNSQLIDEDCVQGALEALERGGHRHDDQMADLLRHIRQDWQAEEEIDLQLGEMVSRWPGRWVIVGTFDVPGHDGAVMQRRRALNEKLANAAKRRGAIFYDPSDLVRDHGAATALDGGGVDIHEYAPAFYATVGETLMRLLRTGKAIGKGSETNEFPPRDAGISASVASSLLAERVNGELVDLHRRRLATLGVETSGLGPHYRSLAERGTLVGAREMSVLELIEAYLPPYDAYAVMRAGLGELALLVAASGRRTIAFEPYSTRRDAIVAGISHLEASGLLERGLLTTVERLTPPGMLEGRVLGLGLGVAHVRTEAAADPHFRDLVHFEALLIDLRIFLRLRPTVEEQDMAADRLNALGFVKRRDYRRERLEWFSRSGAQNNLIT